MLVSRAYRLILLLVVRPEIRRAILIVLSAIYSRSCTYVKWNTAMMLIMLIGNVKNNKENTPRITIDAHFYMFMDQKRKKKRQRRKTYIYRKLLHVSHRRAVSKSTTMSQFRLVSIVSHRIRVDRFVR